MSGAGDAKPVDALSNLREQISILRRTQTDSISTPSQSQRKTSRPKSAKKSSTAVVPWKVEWVKIQMKTRSLSGTSEWLVLLESEYGRTRLYDWHLRYMGKLHDACTSCFDADAWRKDEDAVRIFLAHCEIQSAIARNEHCGFEEARDLFKLLLNCKIALGMARFYVSRAQLELSAGGAKAYQYLKAGLDAGAQPTALISTAMQRITSATTDTILELTDFPCVYEDGSRGPLTPAEEPTQYHTALVTNTAESTSSTTTTTTGAAALVPATPTSTATITLQPQHTVSFSLDTAFHQTPGTNNSNSSNSSSSSSRSSSNSSSVSDASTPNSSVHSTSSSSSYSSSQSSQSSSRSSSASSPILDDTTTAFRLPATVSTRKKPRRLAGRTTGLQLGRAVRTTDSDDTDHDTLITAPASSSNVPSETASVPPTSTYDETMDLISFRNAPNTPKTVLSETNKTVVDGAPPTHDTATVVMDPARATEPSDSTISTAAISFKADPIAAVVVPTRHTETVAVPPAAASASAAVAPRSTTVAAAAAAAAVAQDDANQIVVSGQRYTVLKEVGKGGSSVVYRVLGEDRNVYALKRVKLEDSESSTRQKYMAEIGLLEKLQHCDSVIRLYNSEITDTHVYVVMECGSLDLQTVLRQPKRLDENQLRVYWRQMLEAVHAVHEHEIIHSDLKPANFVVVGEKLKLIDFGIAEALQDEHTSVMREDAMGTLNYMAPETFQDTECSSSKSKQFKVGRPSDVWSLGCILYSMAYGATPFHSLKFMKKINAICNPRHAIAYPAGSDPALVDTIQQCLNRNPRQRATIPHLLNHDFLHPRRLNVAALVEQVRAAALAEAAGAHPCASPATVKRITESVVREFSNATAPKSVPMASPPRQARPRETTSTSASTSTSTSALRSPKAPKFQTVSLTPSTAVHHPLSLALHPRSGTPSSSSAGPPPPPPPPASASNNENAGVPIRQRARARAPLGESKASLTSTGGPLASTVDVKQGRSALRTLSSPKTSSLRVPNETALKLGRGALRPLSERSLPDDSINRPPVQVTDLKAVFTKRMEHYAPPEDGAPAASADLTEHTWGVDTLVL